MKIFSSSVSILMIAAASAAAPVLAAGDTSLVPNRNPFSATAAGAPMDETQVAQRAQATYGPQTFQSLGRRNMAEGDIESAERRFAEALEINPFDPVALNNLAAAKAEQGDYHTALELLERAERLAPQNVDIAANLARLRGWVNYYAGNELHPAARIAVPEARLTEGLPPPPPALWEPQQSRSRVVLPPNPRYGAVGP
ncbi:tetratricopeptide repeat protein [uncultured Abyssibacter sp.]|uniref:tetratricopeptide repeat protein n=1 Tax=uncultured Abyssibacter sp. TaxID=2320202 RepID=UPI0032B2D6EC